LLFILDSNQYIFAFGLAKKPSCQVLLDMLAENPFSFRVRIPRFIIEEVRKHLTPEEFKECILFILELTAIDEDEIITFGLGSKYEAMGLKAADAFIAAYTEWVGADILVSENRHFLSRQANLPFKVLTAESCLKLIKSSLRK